jgi:hypothetical protein
MSNMIDVKDLEEQLENGKPFNLTQSRTVLACLEQSFDDYNELSNDYRKVMQKNIELEDDMRILKQQLIDVN